MAKALTFLPSHLKTNFEGDQEAYDWVHSNLDIEHCVTMDDNADDLDDTITDDDISDDEEAATTTREQNGERKILKSVNFVEYDRFRKFILCLGMDYNNEATLMVYQRPVEDDDIEYFVEHQQRQREQEQQHIQDQEQQQSPEHQQSPEQQQSSEHQQSPEQQHNPESQQSPELQQQRSQKQQQSQEQHQSPVQQQQQCHEQQQSPEQQQSSEQELNPEQHLSPEKQQSPEQQSSEQQQQQNPEQQQSPEHQQSSEQQQSQEQQQSPEQQQQDPEQLQKQQSPELQKQQDPEQQQCPVQQQKQKDAEQQQEQWQDRPDEQEERHVNVKRYTLKVPEEEDVWSSPKRNPKLMLSNEEMVMIVLGHVRTDRPFDGEAYFIRKDDIWGGSWTFNEDISPNLKFRNLADAFDTIPLKDGFKYVSLGMDSDQNMIMIMQELIFDIPNSFNYEEFDYTEKEMWCREVEGINSENIALFYCTVKDDDDDNCWLSPLALNGDIIAVCSKEKKKKKINDLYEMQIKLFSSLDGTWIRTVIMPRGWQIMNVMISKSSSCFVVKNNRYLDNDNRVALIIGKYETKSVINLLKERDASHLRVFNSEYFPSPKNEGINGLFMYQNIGFNTRLEDDLSQPVTQSVLKIVDIRTDLIVADFETPYLDQNVEWALQLSKDVEGLYLVGTSKIPNQTYESWILDVRESLNSVRSGKGIKPPVLRRYFGDIGDARMACQYFLVEEKGKRIKVGIMNLEMNSFWDLVFVSPKLEEGENIFCEN